jgi:RNA polymerase subunit RPABC4/transcription elongation factor Spt4
MTKETEIPKEIGVMLNAQRWCRENDIEHYTKEWIRLFIVIRKNKNIFELELSQTQIEIIAEEFNNNNK